MWVHRFHHAPLQAEALTCLYRYCWVLRKRTDTSCTAVATIYTNGPVVSVVPFVKRDSDTIVGSLEEFGGSATSRLEQPYKRERHHTITQNLKVVGLRIILLIWYSIFTLLSNVIHITHNYRKKQEQKLEKVFKNSFIYSLQSVSFQTMDDNWHRKKITQSLRPSKTSLPSRYFHESLWNYFLPWYRVKKRRAWLALVGY